MRTAQHQPTEAADSRVMVWSCFTYIYIYIRVVDSVGEGWKGRIHVYIVVFVEGGDILVCFLS